jgi:dihydroorotate dehydrogenase electron transfer subunit
MKSACARPIRPGSIHDEQATVVGLRAVAAETFEITLRSPKIAAAARAGQFVNILLPVPPTGYRVVDEADWMADRPGPPPTLLRRPFGVYRRNDDTFDILAKVIGEGTRQLSQLALGTNLDVLGPLGNTFSLPPSDAVAALVAGGCGWAGLGLLARELRDRRIETVAFIGAATEDEIPVDTTAKTRRERFLPELPNTCLTSEDLESIGVRVALAAERGGRVYAGMVTDLLVSILRQSHGQDVHVYACGPWAMLRATADLCRANAVPCQVSLEERMGCGYGVCNSCVVDVFLPDGSVGHKKLCVDGPILDAYEVKWD